MTDVFGTPQDDPGAPPATDLRAAPLLRTLVPNVVSLLLVTMSVAMLADFTRRLFGTDPDGLGIAAIGVQAAFTVAATSTFTKTGWAFLQRSLGKNVRQSPTVRFALSGALFVVTAVMWTWLPMWLARQYNDRAYRLNQTLVSDSASSLKTATQNPVYLQARVLRNYQKATSLDPTLWVAYVNSGKLLEGFYRYDEAAEQYRKAIQAEPAGRVDLTPYANLARALLRDGKPLDALRVIEDAERLPAGPDTVMAALSRNKALAELNLGFYSAAVRDASRFDSAAASCLLAQALEKDGRADEEGGAWARYRQEYAVLKIEDPAVGPECEDQAEAYDEKK